MANESGNIYVQGSSSPVAQTQFDLSSGVPVAPDVSLQAFNNSGGLPPFISSVFPKLSGYEQWKNQQLNYYNASLSNFLNWRTTPETQKALLEQAGYNANMLDVPGSAQASASPGSYEAIDSPVLDFMTNPSNLLGLLSGFEQLRSLSLDNQHKSIELDYLSEALGLKNDKLRFGNSGLAYGMFGPLAGDAFIHSNYRGAYDMPVVGSNLQIENEYRRRQLSLISSTIALNALNSEEKRYMIDYILPKTLEQMSAGVKLQDIDIKMQEQFREDKEKLGIWNNVFNVIGSIVGGITGTTQAIGAVRGTVKALGGSF